MQAKQTAAQADQPPAKAPRVQGSAVSQSNEPADAPMEGATAAGVGTGAVSSEGANTGSQSKLASGGGRDGATPEASPEEVASKLELRRKQAAKRAMQEGELLAAAPAKKCG